MNYIYVISKSYLQKILGVKKLLNLEKNIMDKKASPAVIKKGIFAGMLFLLSSKQLLKNK